MEDKTVGAALAKAVDVVNWYQGYYYCLTAHAPPSYVMSPATHGQADTRSHLFCSPSQPALPGRDRFPYSGPERVQA